MFVNASILAQFALFYQNVFSRSPYESVWEPLISLISFSIH